MEESLCEKLSKMSLAEIVEFDRSMRKNHLHQATGVGGDVLYYSDVHAYKKRFLEKHAELNSWRKVAKDYDIHPNMARMIANGYDPGNKIRSKLRLPDKQAVEVCVRCGQAHVTKRCTSENSKPRPPRIAIRLDNPESAANSIMRNMGPVERDELIDILMERNDTVIT